MTPPQPIEHHATCRVTCTCVFRHDGRDEECRNCSELGDRTLIVHDDMGDGFGVWVCADCGATVNNLPPPGHPYWSE